MNGDDYANEYEKIIMKFTTSVNRFIKREWGSEDFKEKFENMIRGFELESSSLFKKRRDAN